MQYRGGRVEGKKNLKREGKYLINEYGVRFTEKEKKQLESLVNSANRKRSKLLKEEADLPFMVAGKPTGKTVGQTVGLMGKESDFVLAKKSKSLQRFRSKEEYKKYIKNLKKVTQREYIDRRTAQYIKNDIKALKNAFGSQAKDIIKEIKKMPPEAYRKKVQGDETLEISYIYSPTEKAAKLKRIKSALNIPEAETVYNNILNKGR